MAPPKKPVKKKKVIKNQKQKKTSNKKQLKRPAIKKTGKKQLKKKTPRKKLQKKKLPKKKVTKKHLQKRKPEKKKPVRKPTKQVKAARKIKKHRALIDKKHIAKIKKMARKIACSMDFRCYKSDFKDICKAKDIGLQSYILCLDKNPQKCNFSIFFFDENLCKCPMRIYLLKELNI
jgi:hypothetical protein